MKNLKQIVDLRLKEMNLGPVEAAVKGGLERTYIRDIVEGRKKTLRADGVNKLAALLKIDASAFARGDMIRLETRKNNEDLTLVTNLELPNAKILANISGSNRLIPVYGQAVGGQNGEFIMNGNVLYEVLAPPSISEIGGAYAVCISGDSMSPRYEDGEIAFVDPKRRVKKGDYVIAQIKLEEEGVILAFVKRFIRHTSEELVLEQLNPAKELRFSHANVVSVHFIVMAGIAT